MMLTKPCKKCLTQKPLSDFHNHPKTTDRKTTECKSCASARLKIRYQNNGDEIRKRVSARRIANREEVNANLREYYRENADALKAQKKERYKKNPKRYQAETRRVKLFSEYGLTIEQYDLMVIKQAGRCAICAGPPVHNKRLTVDHSHSNGTVRGLLCSECNSGLGFFKDSIIILERALKYLQRDRTNQRGSLQDTIKAFLRADKIRKKAA
jgi:hypothetical protein